MVGSMQRHPVRNLGAAPLVLFSLLWSGSGCAIPPPAPQLDYASVDETYAACVASPAGAELQGCLSTAEALYLPSCQGNALCLDYLKDVGAQTVQRSRDHARKAAIEAQRQAESRTAEERKRAELAKRREDLRKGPARELLISLWNEEFPYAEFREDAIRRGLVRAENAERIRKGSIAIGFDRLELVLAIGAPRSVNRTVTAYGTTEQLVYAYGLYVYLEDGRVTSWQD